MELKRNGSMYVAYTQNRHNGAVTARAYHEYYQQIRKDPDGSFNVARVGSLHFNGDIIEGNIHWVSKARGDGVSPKDRKYHMTRVMCNFTTGLGIDDFQRARQEARNFRDYFRGERQKLLDEMVLLAVPSISTSSDHGVVSDRAASLPDNSRRNETQPRGHGLKPSTRGGRKRKQRKVNGGRKKKRARTVSSDENA
ncbi:hypothetical protein MMC30_005626 [Trapelia coarctata]|nr:hypothetical protein [Trapelia coarctata]